MEKEPLQYIDYSMLLFFQANLNELFYILLSVLLLVIFIDKMNKKNTEYIKQDQKHINIIEQQIIQKSLSKNTEITIYDTQIWNNEKIHTVKIHQKKTEKPKEKCVLLHGFLASSILYEKCFEELSQKYDVFAIDIIGMGLSSRPDIHFNSTQQSIEFLINFLEEWRKQNKIEKMVLVGHSFGGYLSFLYFLRHQQFVSKLVLLSPVGIKNTSKEENWETEKQMIQNMSVSNKIYMTFMHFIWKFQILPMQIFQKCTFIGEFLLKQYLKRRFRVNHQNLRCLYIYFRYNAVQKISTEKLIYQLFFFPDITAYNSIEQQVYDLINKEEISKIPILFLYGDRDWIKPEGAQNLQKNTNLSIKIQTIPNAGHQLTMDNPQYLTQTILNF